MKKSFLCLLVLFFGINDENYAQKFRGILFIGINSSQFDGDDYEGYNKPGLILGAGVNYPLNERWHVNAEFAYSQKGSRETTETTLFQMKIDYLEIPFLIIYRTGSFDFQAGLGYGVLILSKQGDKYGTTDNNCIKESDLPGYVGFNYHFTDYLSFDFRFGYSTMNVLREGCVGNGGFTKGYNNYLSNTLRYKF